MTEITWTCYQNEVGRIGHSGPHTGGVPSGSLGHILLVGPCTASHMRKSLASMVPSYPATVRPGQRDLGVGGEYGRCATTRSFSAFHPTVLRESF